METETATRWLSDEEQRAWRTHLDVSKLLMHQLEKDLQPFGLTINDYEILVNLSESEESRMRMSDLAGATLQSKSRLSHQITRMENAGLVRRENCESDRRGLYAVLTDHGAQVMREVAPHHVASVRRHFIDLMPPAELTALRETLTPVAEHLREQRAG
ncbi:MULTISPECIES: MarR family winged helix-turn-helix transcriptional regulator [Streptomyces]|uniref:MarR family transcriptional regulator n=2 Tax=Streptomyces TaxID=1883 RepID=A0A3M8FBD8_9ACTN|nr:MULTISPECIES: MarR family transcriptional regulator [Streptomyces]KNE80611.1 MarR family transcriptional regulator [Streptomyces fradiae]MCC3651613.1 MarR family transcriptional regulator [Streptomyces sp. S07_1.15]MCC5035616.1 MarR family transcriptional regulator [Streptomyces sp. WAC 00631]MCC9739331.1 MarR family transcriptional regulator [Streptomyces sp. MNU89]OFA61710.1 MarR family transcriptional regulator [Streptomyces fradiae]